MAKKFSNISKAYNEKLEEIISNEDKLIDFIKFYSKFYKYNFQDALCIYCQNEKATAVADYNTWKKIKYQVKKGSQGIGLFDNKTFSKLRYVFDVSSTYQQKINVWEYNENIHKELIDIDFKIEKFKDKYSLENIEDESIKNIFFYLNKIAKEERLGLDEENTTLIKEEINKNIKNFKVKHIESILDSLCNTISQDLREIEITIKNFNKNIVNKKPEKEQNLSVPFYDKKFKKEKVEELNLFDNINENYNNLLDEKIEFISNHIGKEIFINNKKYLIKELENFLDETRVKLEHLDNELYPIVVSATKLEYLDIVYDVLKEQINNKDKEVIKQSIVKDTIIGNTIILNEMVGENLPKGLKGTIRKIDDIGQIHVNWENGSTLAINPQIDSFNILSKEDNQIDSIKEKEEKIDFSFLISNYNINNKKTPYPTTTNEKIDANINAIKVLLELEKHNRFARKDDKEILSNYVGFGGLPQVFEKEEDIISPFIREKAKELKDILTPSEYEKARASTLNAHYTPKEIIDSMYVAIKGFGYNNQKIKILEPSCGIGNFIGNLPIDLRDSKIVAVELDTITGKIAKQLYPNANIKINGFEKEDFNDNSFDLVVGNVPFGDYSVYDKTYNKNNYLVHDYFINKSIALTKPNGIVAIITSKGTLDKKDDTFRRKISKKAELVGAIRLPNTAFKKLAGTEVTSDILFFQKLEQEREEVPEWVNTTEVKYENRINNYFINHPEMILGTLDYKSNRYGRYDLTVVAENINLNERILETVDLLPKNIVNQNNIELNQEDILEDEEIEEILLNDNYKNFRYIYHNGNIFYKSSKNQIEKVETKSRERLISIIKLRDMSKELIAIQLDRYTEEDIFNEKLEKFNKYYDEFVDTYGYINNRTNINLFRDDDDIHFLTSLEKVNNGKYEKSDFFYKKTIYPNIEIQEVDNAKDGLILSLNKFADINFDYIKSLYNKPINEIIDELVKDNLIYLNPLKYKKENIEEGWEIKPIYLNGNVKEKLNIVENLKNESPYFERNINALKEVIPKDVDFSDIKIDIGSDLYKPEDMKDFLKDLLKISNVDVRYNERSSEWRIYNKTTYGYLATEEYGTNRMGALYIFEKILNNQEIAVKDEVEDESGKKRYITNKNETIKANEKKILIERAFDDFIFKNSNIRDRIVKEYNGRFNNSINANFDLELSLPNLSPDIKLRPHQKVAISRSIFSPNNLLLDHQVGAGKTFIMIVSAMENKRLGKSNKPLLVVPNNITAQFKNDFYRLYPNANILYADEKSFETKNRKRFLSKISQNDYDAIIMGQSQFDLLKISKERQIYGLEEEIKNIIDEMSGLDKNEDRLTVKILERTKKSLELNLTKLMDSKTDDLLRFEELGIDSLYVDEAHLYKNLYFTTRLRKISGINQTNSQKAMNLKMKIDYLEEIGAKIIFATGTPISNTMAEMYTMQKYLMQDILKEQGIYNFDSWQKIFASTETKLEISPAGNGFQLKTRFSNFRNIPELMKLYNSFADVVTTDMINLPLPRAINEIIQAETSEELAIEMKSFGERAEKCKNGSVNPKDDNMLKIVHEGRYAGLDIRHINENNEDYEDSKVNLVVNKVIEIYNKTKKEKGTQVIFSDISTPNTKFNIYDDIRLKLIKNGISTEEIAFIHNAKNSKEREKMFEKVRNGDIRVILGSTAKMGAGTNFQNKLVALYHLDTPWRPSDLEQREGRILRQGNENEEVYIFKCITKGSFDAYSWQILEQKQKFITQAKIGAITGREVKDIDDVTLDYAEIKALATGNPKIKRKMEVDNEIEKIKILETSYRKKQYENEKFIKEEYPEKLGKYKERLKALKVDNEYYSSIKNLENDKFEIIIKDNKYIDKEVAGALLIEIANASNIDEKIGEYKGFKIYSSSNPLNADIKLIRCASHRTSLNNGYKKANIDLLDDCLEKIDTRIDIVTNKISNLEERKEQAEKSINTDFEYKETLESLFKEKNELEREFEQENKTFIHIENEEIEEVKDIDMEIEI